MMVKGGHKHIEIAQVAAHHHPKVIGITETHLDDSFQDGEIDIPGYRILRSDRDKKCSKKKKGGGVVAYVRQEFEVANVSREAGVDFELLGFDMPGEIRYVILYRPPGPSISGEAIKHIEKEFAGRGSRLLAGDLNMNMDVKRPQPAQLHRLLENELGMKQNVKFVTRCKKAGGTTIDHVWSNIPCKCSPLKEFNGLSDHRAIRAIHAQEGIVVHDEPRFIMKRHWDNASSNEMIRIVKEEFAAATTGVACEKASNRKRKAHEPRQAEQEMRERGVGYGRWGQHGHEPAKAHHAQRGLSLCESMEAWDNAWHRIKKQVVPLVRTKIRPKRRNAKWFNSKIKSEIKERIEKEQAVQSAQETEKEAAKTQLKEAARKVEHSIIQAKRNSYHEELAKLPKGSITDSKEGWSLYNKVNGRKNKCTAQPACSADEICNAFLGKIERIREPLLKHAVKQSPLRDIPEMMSFRRVAENDVLNAIKKDRGTRSVGVDDIPMSVLKKIVPNIASEIASIANASIAERRWPEQWKKAEVVPIWKKKGDRKDPLFYRPISMLPAIARLIERMLAEQIKDHIRKHSILPDFQHGFRAGHSTETALVQLIDEIASEIDDGEVVLVASLDLAGAFDTLDREVLIEKLSRYCGIRGAANDLIKEYLEQRLQRVRKREERGAWKENPWGVPQGSVLGPLLFVLYMADLQEAITAASVVQYADDVTLVVTADTMEEACSKMNQSLDEFQKYAVGSRLAAEPSKTQLMVCATRKTQRTGVVKCTMGECEIAPKDSMKILGVTIDDRLSWEIHNAAAAGKATGIARSVARSTKFLRLSDRSSLIQALAHPVLDYCQTALARPSAIASNSIRRAYNRTARIATQLARSEPARKRVQWTEWEERRAAVDEAFVAKVWNKGEPKCLRELLPETDNRRAGTSRADKRGEIAEESAGRIGKKAFRVWGPEAYNRTCRRSTTRAKVDEKGSENAKRRKGRSPEDCDAKERNGYYAYLDNKFKGKKESRDDCGRLMIWTDGSSVESEKGGRRAGTGIFYGDGNEKNCALTFEGSQTNQRAE
eukprot:gene2548-biopygen33462